MAAESTGPDAVRLYLTGASEDAGTQGDPVASLGGYRATTRVSGLSVYRLNPIRSIKIIHVSATNGTGNGVLAADTVDSLTWTPPGGTVGTSVTIQNEETKIIQGGTDTAKYVVVERISATDMAGSETDSLLDEYANAIGGSEFDSTEAAAGEAKYRGFMFRNGGSLSATGLTVWIDTDYSGHTQIAKEAVGAGGDIQTIADEEAQPGGLSWVSPTTEGAGLGIGTLAAGTTYGLWQEQSVGVGATADPRVETVIHYSFTYDGVKYTKSLRGLHRIANASLARYELFVGQDAEADLDAVPDATSATSPFSLALASGHTYKLSTQERNQWNLSSKVYNPTTLIIDGGGDEDAIRPTAPRTTSIASGADGAAVIKATYFPNAEGSTQALINARKADTWVIWLTTDGTAPDPDVDIATDTQAMVGYGGPETLEWSGSSNLDGTPLTAVVRTRRTDAGPTLVDSTNTATITATADALGPDRPDGLATFGKAAGIHQALPTLTDTTTYIDQPNNIYWLQKVGETQLWGDTVLIWNLKHDGLYTYFTLAYEAVSGAAPASDEVEVASWTAGDKRLVIPVGGVRRMKIDVTNQIVTIPLFDPGQDIVNSVASAPIWFRYATTHAQYWNPVIQDHATGMHLDSDGTAIMADIPWISVLNQAACL